MRAVSWSPLALGRCSPPLAMALPYRRTLSGRGTLTWPSCSCLEMVGDFLSLPCAVYEIAKPVGSHIHENKGFIVEKYWNE